MAIDYGGMMALTKVFEGTSEARRNRRVEEGNMRQEILQQEKIDFNNAEMIGKEQASIETSRDSYLKQVQNIPHMREYVNNYFDDQTLEFKGLIKSFNGRYSTAMSSGKVLDFRDGLMANLKKSDKYQQGVMSATNMATLDGYSQNKETQDLISRRDLNNKSRYLAGKTDSFELSGLRAKYDSVEAADYYEGERPDFDKIFSSQYSSIVHNWALEHDDPQQEKLAALAENYFPGDPNGKDKYLKSFAKDDMGVKGAYDTKMTGTKELGPVEASSRIRNVFNQTADGPSSAYGMLVNAAGQPIMQQLGVRAGGPEMKGKVQIAGYEVFNAVPDAILKEAQLQFGDAMSSNGDGTFDFTHVKRAFDANGVYMDDQDGDDTHTNMTYNGAHMVTKARFLLPDGVTVKEHIMGDAKDKDVIASMKAEFGKNVTYLPTMVATFQNDNALKFWDKQVMIEMDPKSVSMERIMANTGVEEKMQASAESSKVINKASSSSHEDLEQNLSRARVNQQKEGNTFFKGTGGELGEDATMDVVAGYFAPEFQVMQGAEESKGIIYSIASIAAKGKGGDFAHNSKQYMNAMSTLLKSTDSNGRKFQKAIETNDPTTVYNVMNIMFGDIGDKDEILKLAEIWSNYN
tara:strand:- start:3249 stop:5144 length:1896 start_codon:yes stop_codon:yes gene_type:complete